MRRHLGACILTVTLAACGGGSAGPTPPLSATPVPAFSLTSSAFAAGAAIPTRYSCDGAGVSPPLAWSGAPTRTAAYALVVHDPDAPRGDFTHWLLVDLPASATALPEGVPTTERPPTGGVQGRNDAGRLGYTPPCPPAGSAHHYHFTLYALDHALGLAPGATRQQVTDALRGHVLAEGQLVGTYKRGG